MYERGGSEKRRGKEDDIEEFPGVVLRLMVEGKQEEKGKIENY